MRRLLAAAGVWLGLGLAGSAGATHVLAGIGDTVGYDNGSGATGTITLVASATGTPAGAVSTVGTIGASDLALIFSVTPTAGDLDEVGVGAVFCDPGPLHTSIATDCTTSFAGRSSSGAGWGPDGSDIDITSFSGTAATRIFRFDADGDGQGNDDGLLNVGESSDLFFVTWAAGDILTLGQHNINFMISPNGGVDFTQAVTLIPEPSTLFLVGLGLGGVAIAGRRRHR